MSNDLFIMHYGVGHDKGGHSGRYPWGSGKNPKQDLKTLKKVTRKDFSKSDKAKERLMGKHPWLIRETYASILSDAGINTTIGAGMKKNRPAVKAAISRRLKTDPEFRNQVRIAKKETRDAARRAVENAESFIKYYGKSPDSYSEKQVNKAKKYLSKYKDIDAKSGVSDVDFATTALFDDRLGENRARSIYGGAIIIASSIALFKSIKDA